MRAVLSLCAIVLALTVALSFLPVFGEETVYDDVIRLHVIANSDSDEDQADKLAVRDSILSYITGELDGVGGVDEAAGKIGSLLGEVETVAKRTLASRGKELSVRAEFGRDAYPEREYDGYSLPAGNYVSLRVILGEGEGHNWWCVLFPSLCTKAAEKEDFIEAGVTSEGYRMIKDTDKPRYKVRFRILEILSDVFGTEY